MRWDTISDIKEIIGDLIMLWNLLKPRVSCHERNPFIEEICCRYDNPMITLREIPQKEVPCT